MGEMAEYYADLAMMEEAGFRDIERGFIRPVYRRRNGFWVTAEGEYLKITEMDTRHLENCAKLIERNGYQETNATYPEIVTEINKRYTEMGMDPWVDTTLAQRFRQAQAVMRYDGSHLPKKHNEHGKGHTKKAKMAREDKKYHYDRD